MKRSILKRVLTVLGNNGQPWIVRTGAFLVGIMLLFTCGCNAETMDEGTENHLNVIFTIDVEDNRGNDPNLIEGDLSAFGISENCGINYILDTLDQFGAKAVFFVNIYEHNLYDDDYMPSLLKRIDERGNEVALHAHVPSDKSLPFYTKALPITDEAIQYGSSYIESAIGKKPVSYRAGAYYADDTLIKILQENGFLIDSSLYYGNDHNAFEMNNGRKNQTFEMGGIIEFPIVVIFNGSSWKKLDLDVLSEKELIASLESIRKSGLYETVQLMFHSFSFLNLNSNNGELTFLVDEGNRKIYGEDTADKEKCISLLQFLTESENYSITTFREVDPNTVWPEYDDDNIIYLANRELAFEKKNISVSIQNNQVILENDFVANGLKYAWVILDSNNNKIYYSGYSADNAKDVYVFSEDNSGKYTIKAYIENPEGKKQSGKYYSVVVKDGIPVEIQ